jgi:hypothetical protein
MVAVVAEPFVQEAVRLGLIAPADADRYRDRAVPPPDRPFDGALWTTNRRIAYAIASAASGVVADLPPRPLPTPARSSRRVAENPPAHRKRKKLKGAR